MAACERQEAAQPGRAPGNLGNGSHIPSPGTWRTHHRLADGEGGVRFLVSLPGLNENIEPRPNTCLRLCCARRGCNCECGSSPCSHPAKASRSPGWPWHVCNPKAMHWGLRAGVWILEPSFSLLALLGNDFIYEFYGLCFVFASYSLERTCTNLRSLIVFFQPPHPCLLF